METVKLYRPVNKDELKLIEESSWKAFPPRLPEQPIFYPVTNQEYASQITKEWNLPSYKNGFVTEFELSKAYLSKFDVQKVGLDHHTELWVPAEDLDEFNNEIINQIKVIEAYDSNPDNEYVMIKNLLKVKNEIYITFRFINQVTDFEITEESKLDEIKLKKYLQHPRKLDNEGKLDLESFVVVSTDPIAENKIKPDKIYLLRK